MFVCPYQCPYVCVCGWMCKYACMFVCVRMYVIRTHVCMCARARVCVYVCVFNLNTYITYMHTYMHTYIYTYMHVRGCVTCVCVCGVFVLYICGCWCLCTCMYPCACVLRSASGKRPANPTTITFPKYYDMNGRRIAIEMGDTYCDMNAAFGEYCPYLRAQGLRTYCNANGGGGIAMLFPEAVAAGVSDILPSKST